MSQLANPITSETYLFLTAASKPLTPTTKTAKVSLCEEVCPSEILVIFMIAKEPQKDIFKIIFSLSIRKPCNLCDYQGASKGHLKNHIQSVHEKSVQMDPSERDLQYFNRRNGGTKSHDQEPIKKV